MQEIDWSVSQLIARKDGTGSVLCNVPKDYGGDICLMFHPGSPRDVYGGRIEDYEYVGPATGDYGYVPATQEEKADRARYWADDQRKNLGLAENLPRPLSQQLWGVLSGISATWDGTCVKVSRKSEKNRIVVISGMIGFSSLVRSFENSSLLSDKDLLAEDWSYLKLSASALAKIVDRQKLKSTK